MAFLPSQSGWRRQVRKLLLALQTSSLMPWPVRRTLLGFCGCKLGAASYIEPGAHFASGDVSIGDHAYINRGFLIDGLGPVRIGARVRIGPGVKILTATHRITEDPLARASAEVVHAPVTIEDGVWLGAGAVVMPGRTVRSGCVIGAGAVVTRDTDRDGLYLGVPARHVRTLPTI
ncbi:acyltransferase [Dongia sedimenti]|uniref:DapH/DapD/GlmU-related protein n=1 Tax=Dongia sedimenti TaxID=3064282 RepID=A0ABU0YR64_9PROT|nr:DapH/DapD/GlmU-related protein [Rhodospirillaceae bacterium R-7]